jgi:hypothetical protein
MLTLIALSALALQEPPAPPVPPETRTRVMVMGPQGAGSLDSDGDGLVSREEFAAPMNDHFGRMDKNGDGRLSGDELAMGADMEGDHGAMIRRFRGGPGEQQAMVFVAGPEGGPGVHEVIIRGPGDPAAPHVIHVPRHGGPGEETRFEIRTLGGAGDGPGEIDKDGDGRISEAEFISPVRDAFGRMDSDHSGYIEAGERHGGDGVHVFTRRIETRDDD